MTLLSNCEWRTSYRHEDGDLVELFYNPALACAVQHDLMRNPTPTSAGAANDFKAPERLCKLAFCVNGPGAEDSGTASTGIARRGGR